MSATLATVAPADDDIKIRPFHERDQAGLAQLVSTVLGEYGFTVDPVLESDLSDPQGSYDSIWVAIHNEHVIGSVAIRLVNDEPVAELKRMYLQPPYRGRGLGRSLLHQALDWAQSRRCQSIVLDTSTAMTAAQHLYESAGFVRTGFRTETGAHDSRCEVLYKLELAAHP